ncbi:MAG: phospholipid carrier-dependent glycosyltransferase [Candidatus Krumholzibacteriota bacterium]|nr:phospholipid carrier-dependent glycosyltransferase [Candidatus Krumholzibacteriota bacterium]
MANNRQAPYTLLILCALIAAGFLLRSYHIDYPPIGYNSMEEVQYLSVAKGYLDHGDLLHKRVLYYGMTGGEGYMRAFPRFPFLPLTYWALWSLFGVHIWMARFVIILFSLGSVILSWMVARRLGADSDTAIVTAFFMTVMPLSVFFGRNIQPDSSALFFLLLSTLFFLKWTSSFRTLHLAVFSVSFFMTALVKGPFLFLLLPIIFLFPFRSVIEPGERKKISKQMIWPAAAAAGAAVWLIISRMTAVYSSDLSLAEGILLPGSVSPGFGKWSIPVIWRDIGENYTYIYFGFAAAGVIWSVMNAGTKLARYILGVLVSSVFYFIFLSESAAGESYCHMPFIPGFSLSAAAGLAGAVSLKGILKNKQARRTALVILVAAALPSVRTVLYEKFDRMVPGSDIAGEYIRDNGYKEDRVFISYGSPSDKGYDVYRKQLYGTLWSAGKRGSMLPNDYKRIIFGEAEWNFNWILLYDLPWNENDQRVMDFIKNNYYIKQIGYKGDKLIYYLLRSGGKFDPSDLKDRPMRKAGTYGFSSGSVDINVKEI